MDGATEERKPDSSSVMYSSNLPVSMTPNIPSLPQQVSVF